MRAILQKCNCSVRILPITDYPEKNTLYNPTWEDSGVLTYVYNVGSQSVVDRNLAIHVKNCKPLREVYELTLPDGWYKIRSFILPTKKSLVENFDMVDGFEDVDYNIVHADDPIKNETTMIIAVDEESPTGFSFLARKSHPSVYKTSGLYYWVQITDVKNLYDEIESREVIDGYLYGTNIKVIQEDYIEYCNLEKCFITRATNLLGQYSNCSSHGICNSSEIKCKSNVDEFQILIRDYLWMSLNAIKYAIDCEDYETASKLLNCVSSCAGVCDGLTNKQSKCDCS